MGTVSNSKVLGVRTRRDNNRSSKRKHAEMRAAEWNIQPGDRWRIVGRNGIEHTLDCSDGSFVSIGTEGTLVFDPPWDQLPGLPSHSGSVLALTDAAHLANVLGMFGCNVAWQFVWDCGACFVQGKKPIQRYKCCLWYGSLDEFKHRRAEVPAALRDGKTKLSDLYPESLTKLLAESPHPHAKPLLWITHLIGRCARDVVVDPYLGSGTTLLACEATGRRCVAHEIDPAWCAVALDRFVTAGLGVELVR